MTSAGSPRSRLLQGKKKNSSLLNFLSEKTWEISAHLLVRRAQCPHHRSHGASFGCVTLLGVPVLCDSVQCSDTTEHVFVGFFCGLFLNTVPSFINQSFDILFFHTLFLKITLYRPYNDNQKSSHTDYIELSRRVSRSEGEGEEWVRGLGGW